MILSRDHSAKAEDGRHPHERAPGELNALTEKGPQRSMLKRMLQKPLVVATLAAAIVASPLSPNKVEAAPLSLSPSATVERFDADTARFVPQSVRSLSPGDAFLFEKRYHRVLPSGELRGVPGITASALADTHRAYSAQESRLPTERDVVWTLDSDSGGHILLSELRAPSRLLFQGKVYALERAGESPQKLGRRSPTNHELVVANMVWIVTVLAAWKTFWSKCSRETVSGSLKPPCDGARAGSHSKESFKLAEIEDITKTIH